MPWCKALMEHFLKGIERHWWCNNPNEKIKKSSLLSLILTLPSSKCSFSTWTYKLKISVYVLNTICLQWSIIKVFDWALSGFQNRFDWNWMFECRKNSRKHFDLAMYYWTGKMIQKCTRNSLFKKNMFALNCSREVLQILPYF